MKALLQSYKILIIATCLQTIQSINTNLLEIETSQLSDAMKEFMTFVIRHNWHEKDGFLFIMINRIAPEFSDFAMNLLSKNASVIILNFDLDKTNQYDLNPNHLKFVLTDPDGELTHAEASFKRVRVSRAKVILILTKEPLPIFVAYILNSYRKIQVTNVIIAYERDGTIEVLTHNPYLPTHDKIVNLTATKYTEDLFYDKGRDLFGSTIKALLTHPDRTKIRRIQSEGEDYYEGKDFSAINTMITHLNGRLKVEDMDNILLNPWYESLVFENRSGYKKRIIQRRDIALLIKSETFATNDGIVENLYPHTQNDLTVLVPKSAPFSLLETMTTICTPDAWWLYILAPSTFVAIQLVSRWLLRRPSKSALVLFNIMRILIANNVFSFPKLSLERILLLGWIFYSFIMNLFLQSKVTSFLAIQKYYPDIDTIDELFSANLSIYALPKHIEEVEKKYVGTQHETAAESLLPMASNEGLIDLINYRSEVMELPAVVHEHDIAVFVSRNRNFRRNGAPFYHLLQESLIPNYQAYKVVHGSPLLTILNKKLRNLLEGGFIDLWAQRTIEQATIEGFLYPDNYQEKEIAMPLTLVMVKLPFYCWIFGTIAACAAFGVELIGHHLTKPKRIPFRI